MIIETLELTGSEKSLSELTSAVTVAGEFNDILEHRAFLYITKDKGIVRVNTDKTIDILDGTDLSAYVKNTDYATYNKGGVVKIDDNRGIQISSSYNTLILREPTAAQIAARGSAGTTIALNVKNVNDIVKAALTDDKRITDMTDDEKTKARAVIDAAAKSDVPKASSDLTDGDTIAKTNVNNNFDTAQTINGTLTVNGDIVQNGKSYETHAEQLFTKNDIIKTREGAVGGLADGEFTGIEAEKYDGTNNGRLVFDADGVARVGDVNDEQPLLTRDEVANLADGQVFVWDGTNLKAVGSSDFIKNTDIASTSQVGVIRVGSGLMISASDGSTHINKATEAQIDEGTDDYRPIVPSNLDYAVRSVLPLTSDTLPETLVANTEYYLGESATISFSLPDGELGQYCFVKFDSGTTPTVFSVSSTNFVGDIPTPIASKTYEFIATWNGSKWACSYRGY